MKTGRKAQLDWLLRKVRMGLNVKEIGTLNVLSRLSPSFSYPQLYKETDARISRMLFAFRKREGTLLKTEKYFPMVLKDYSSQQVVVDGC